MSSSNNKPLLPAPPTLEHLVGQIQHINDDTSSWGFLRILALALPAAVLAYFAVTYVASLALGSLHFFSLRGGLALTRCLGAFAAALFVRGVLESVRREVQFRRVALVLTAAYRQFPGAHERRWIEDQLDNLCLRSESHRSWSWYNHAIGEPLSRTGILAAASKALGMVFFGTLAVYAVAPFLGLPSLSQAIGLLGAAGVLGLMRWGLAYQGVTLEYPGSDTYTFESAIQDPTWLRRSARRSLAGNLAVPVLLLLWAGNLAMQTSLDENAWAAQTAKGLHTLALSNTSEQDKIAQLVRLKHSLDPNGYPAFGVVPDTTLATLTPTPWLSNACLSLGEGDGFVCSDTSQVARAVIHVVGTLPDQKAAYTALAARP